MMHLETLETRTLCSAIPSIMLAGDCNADGLVNQADMAVIANNWNAHTGLGAIAGDANHDGLVNIADMAVVANNWGKRLYDGRAAVIDGVVNVWAANPADTGATWAGGSLYGADGIPHVTAIHQGQIGDCYFLAAVGAMAMQTPSLITQAIAFDGTGWAVTWHDANTGAATIVHTSVDLSQSLQAQTGETWWEVMEKSFAEFRTWNGHSSADTFASLNNGFVSTVWAELGIASRGILYFGQTITATSMVMQAALSAGELVTWDTSFTATTMVPDHSYVVMSVSGTTATLYNPWGAVETHDLNEMELNGVLNWQLGTLFGA